MRKIKVGIVAAINLLVEAWIQKRCLLTEHDPVTEFGPAEVFERCQRCGRRSDGWQIVGRPVLKFEGDPARHVLDDGTLESVFGIPAGDPSPFFEDAGFERVVDPGNIVPVHSRADLALMMMPTSRTKH